VEELRKEPVTAGLILLNILVFLIVEVIRGKRVPPEKEGYVHLAGMALLLCLMVFVMYNDIRRIFF
jgi:regulator of sigma E protease